MAGQKQVNNVAKKAASDGKISGTEAKAIQAAAAKSGGSAAVAVSNQAAKGITVSSGAQQSTGLTIKPSGQITYDPAAVTSQLPLLDQMRINYGVIPNPAPVPVNDKFVQNTAGTFSYIKPAITAANTNAAGNANTNASTDVAGGNSNTPNNGEYNNILDLINQQREEAKAQIEFWQNKATEDANANAQQIAAIQAGADQQAASLQQMMLGQQQAFQQQQALQQQQVAAAQAAYEEQRRQTDALGRAFVPNLQPSAAAPAVGDSRSSGSSSSNSNTLSSLSILSGIGSELTASSMTPVLAGLQIA